MPSSALQKLNQTFQRWLGQEYDLATIHAVLATAAVERLGTGDLLWLLVLSGSGNAKTETVQALASERAIVTSTISSPGALLSGSPKKETASDATGGLLKRFKNNSGVLVIKDVTSILSASREMRGEVLAALREVYDGKWERNLGVDGGRSLNWEGRIAVVGAVTDAWDQAHTVISSMGDRFVLLRSDSSRGRRSAAKQAMANLGHEQIMRAELKAVVKQVLDGVSTQEIPLSEVEEDRLIVAADLVTHARAAVTFDYRGQVEHVSQLEAPTRFAKQLLQVMRGGLAIGLERPESQKLALRCAHDSIPPLRMQIMVDAKASPGTTIREMFQRLGKPRSTVQRQVDALHALGLLTCTQSDDDGAPKGYWLADGVDPEIF